MAWQSTPFTIPLLATSGIFLAVLVVGLRRLRDDPPAGTRQFLIVVAAGMVWTTAYALELASTDLAVKLAMSRLIWVAIAVIAVFWPAFALAYAGQIQHVSRRLLGTLSVVPAVYAVILLATATESGLVYDDPYLRTAFGLEVLEYSIGPAMWGFITYLYAVFLVVTVLLGRVVLGSHSTLRWQAGTIFVAGTLPVLASLVTLFELVPIAVIDLTAVSFAVTSVLIAVSLFRHGFLEVAPVAEGAVLDELEAGILVVDQTGRVVTANDRCRGILGLTDAPVVGRQAASLLEDYPELQVAIEDEVETSFDWTVEPDDPDADSRVYDVSVSPNRAAGGTVVALRDVTERNRREELLRRQKEQLDTFASVVSHDLRSPLSVARGYLEFARETGDEEDFEKVEHAHERMDRLLDDLLTLARQGESIEEPEPVDLGDVVTAAWGSVDTAGATLEFEAAADTVVVGDRGRIQQLFENLFRNAAEHARPTDDEGSDGVEPADSGESDGVEPADSGESDGVESAESGGSGGVEPADTGRASADAEPADLVTVRVGRTEDGFYVADDGPGIPEEARESVFEYGFSTAEEGTGIGLDIVDRIARAHDWTVRATESESGGARFEVSGVEFD